MILSLIFLLAHTLLANILGAFKREDTGRRNAVLDEEFGLEFTLWEVLKKNSRAQLLRKALDQCHSLFFLFCIVKTR